MKNENIILLALGAYALYYFYNRQKATTPLTTANSGGGGGGGGGGSSSGGGGYALPPQTVIQTQYIPTTIRPSLAVSNYTRPIVQQQSAVLQQNTGNIAGFDAYDNYGIFGLCDTSNKLTRYGTNNNFNAATLKY